MNEYLVMRAISKRFGSVKAVDDVSFSCAKGELVAILGPSGCGKTTLLRIVAGFEHADSGSVNLGGEPLAGRPPESRQIGFLFQNYALFPHMMVAQNIGYGLRFPRRRRDDAVAARVAELLDLVDLPGYQDRRPDQLSAGQQQRVAIARALAPQPRLLLLDEPLSALDVSLRDHLRLNIRRIQRELSLTTLYVTHDQEEALSISDRVVVMNQGRIEQTGPAKEVYERPASAFVATFFGRTSLIPAHLFASETEYMDGRAPAQARLVLRAEDVRPEGPGLPLHGHLKEVEYLGHIVRLQVMGEFGVVWGTAPGSEIAHWSEQRDKPVTLYFEPDKTAFIVD